MRWLAGILVATVLLPAPALAFDRQDECRFQSLEWGTWTELEEIRTARCLLDKWPTVSWTILDDVISDESGWYRKAYNPAGPYVGLAQHDLGSWSSRLRSYRPDGWELSPRWTNSRTMLTVTIRMMGAEGLGPWGR